MKTLTAHRGQAFEVYNKALESALRECQDENVKERLQKMKEISNVEIDKDWELWLEERKVISDITTIINGSINGIGNDDDYDDDDIENLEDKENMEDNRELSIVNSPITTDDVPKAIASLFESSQEDLITEENLSREEMVIPSVHKQLLKIPLKNKILNPAYYGIIDLTGQHIRTKTSFAVDDWEEFRNLFGTIVQWQSIQAPENFANYFDDNFKLPPNPEDKLTSFHTAVQFLRESYPIKNSLSEQHATHALYYPVINTVLRDDIILPMDWGEIASSSSSNAKNDNVSHFKITLKPPNYKLQAVHGEISGGFNLKVYAMIWCSGGVYLFGLVDQFLIPSNLETFYSLEEVYVILKTLQKKVTEASSALINIERNHAKKKTTACA
ncbi:hypothetical protein C2G38_2149573 [Gigaspora rosea]|uniref:Uncharacterized protein n=1 Tax=Gigaspora rosea TaxID=44941 RepID=A0A397TZD2_9GLOM|nr:hypothetical protein C2G38_2149573 [Gigaspora rosea]